MFGRVVKTILAELRMFESCLQRIVGALYHCVTCDSWGESVNICSNCESAGLPGNLEASDKGHSLGHILIKVKYYLLSIYILFIHILFKNTYRFLTL